MIYDREESIQLISNTLAHVICNIKLRQKLNDLSLNIHAEDFFTEVFNYVYSANYQNANSNNSNEAYIDLVDHKKQSFVQITTTTSADKIKNSFKIKADPQYKNYTLDIYYLLEKPTPNKTTVTFIKSTYGISNVKNHLLDFGDLLRDISSLSEEKIIELYKLHFTRVKEAYTDEIALQNVIETLVAERKHRYIPLDADFTTIEFEDKIELNNICERLERKLKEGLDYSDLISNLEVSTLSDLRQLTIEQCYREALIQKLRGMRVDYESLKTATTEDLHGIAVSKNVDFNVIIYGLTKDLNSKIYDQSEDFNCDQAIWSILAYFFHICFLGVKEK
ncbi:SMEK domain-containing protein [Vibrio tubiashii]|uniref:SMEK domain-containing protein n=1 Tax=Vibrio tubiashii TaxID=29498 RepID=A0AAE5LGD9_9VIBR|nr:SMEK domain-containing protein [Vibrio tubiashii]NOI79268.1 SMEK domain-containing protein [Vibrio tubiashii]